MFLRCKTKLHFELLFVHLIFCIGQKRLAPNLNFYTTCQQIIIPCITKVSDYKLQLTAKAYIYSHFYIRENPSIFLNTSFIRSKEQLNIDKCIPMCLKIDYVKSLTFYIYFDLFKREVIDLNKLSRQQPICEPNWNSGATYHLQVNYFQ